MSACPKCGCQIMDPFRGTVQIHDVEKCGGVTVFRCGPSKCDHDYQGHEDVLNEHGRIVGGTTVCTKCGARAIDEAVWV